MTQSNSTMGNVGAALRRWVGGVRLAYLPVLLTYLCFGASIVTNIALLYFEKGTLALTPAEAAGIAFWLGLPWSMKMMVGVTSDVRTKPAHLGRLMVMVGLIGLVPLLALPLLWREERGAPGGANLAVARGRPRRDSSASSRGDNSAPSRDSCHFRWSGIDQRRAASWP